MPAAHRDLVGVHRDARPGDDVQMTAADLGGNLKDGPGDDGPGEVEPHVPAGHRHLNPAWHHPLAVALGVPAAHLDLHEVLRGRPFGGKRGGVAGTRAGGQVSG